MVVKINKVNKKFLCIKYKCDLYGIKLTFLVGILILFKGDSSMEEDLPYRKVVGGRIPLHPVYIN